MAEVKRYAEDATNYVKVAGSTLLNYLSTDIIWFCSFADVNFLENFVDILFCCFKFVFMGYLFFKLVFFKD